MTKSFDFFQAIYFGASSQSVGINIYRPPCHTLSSPQYDIYSLSPWLPMQWEGRSSLKNIFKFKDL